jgi:hypothetical protein
MHAHCLLHVTEVIFDNTGVISNAESKV